MSFVFAGPHLRAHEGSQARLNQSRSLQPMPQPQQRQIWATSLTYTTAHGNAGSWIHWARPGIEPASPWMLVRFFSTDPRGELFCSLVLKMYHIERWSSLRFHHKNRPTDSVIFQSFSFSLAFALWIKLEKLIEFAVFYHQEGDLFCKSMPSKLLWYLFSRPYSVIPRCVWMLAFEVLSSINEAPEENYFNSFWENELKNTFSRTSLQRNLAKWWPIYFLFLLL